MKPATWPNDAEALARGIPWPDPPKRDTREKYGARLLDLAFTRSDEDVQVWWFEHNGRGYHVDCYACNADWLYPKEEEALDQMERHAKECTA